MNKRVLFLFVLPFFVISCTTRPEVFVPLDYSEEDVVRNEINEIEKILPQNSVEALWRSFLLKEKNYDNQTLESEISVIFEKCASAVLEECDAAYSEKNYINSQRLYASLQAINYGGISKLDFDGQSISEGIAEMLPIFSASGSAFEKKTSSVSSYIQGTVTIWVDLGIQVQKGVGYASHVIGSGFFINDTGYIVTNYHVIQTEVDPEYEGYSRLYVKLAEDSDTRIPAKVVGWDSMLDLALLKVEIDSPYSFSLGSSADLDVGDKIYAIGSPAGLEQTLTSGIVSAVNRQLFTIGSVMQIDAALNSGNSGGPIIDENGNVQAVAFAGMLEYQGLNFAIPVEYLKKSLPFLVAGGQRKHGWFEAFGKDIKEDEFLGRPSGLEVQYIMPGGSAYRSGLKIADVVTAIDGMPVDGIESFHDAMLKFSSECIVKVSVWSNGENISFPVYIAERPENPGYEIYKRDLLSNAFLPIFGMELASVDSSSKEYTVSKILKGSTADESGFSVHDPVRVVKVQISDEEDVVFAQLYTKKRKNGYFEVSIMVGAALDSPFFF